MTIGKQRLLVTENALRLEPGQPSAGRGSDGITPALGHRARERRATSSPPAARRSKLSRFTSKAPRDTGYRAAPPIFVPSKPSTAPDLKIILNQPMAVVSGA